MGAREVVMKVGRFFFGPEWRPGKYLPGYLLIAFCAFGLELIGVHTGAYTYDASAFKIWGVPLDIMALWTVVGALSWWASTRRGVLTGVLTGVLVDLLLLEPLAYNLRWWWWTSDFTPHLGMFGTVGNIIAWTAMTLLSVVVLTRNDKIHVAEGERMGAFVSRALVLIPLGKL